MDISELNPYIRYVNIHRFHHNQPYISICYDCRLFFMENASGRILINGTEYNFSNGDLIYLPPTTKYKFKFETKENFKVIVLNFDLTNDFRHLSASLGTATEQTYVSNYAPNYEPALELSAPICKSMPHLKTNLIECVDFHLKKRNFYKEHSSALVKICLLELVDQSFRTTIHSDVCEKVIAYIQKNYASPLLTNKSIAEKFNYHPYHLSRIFKEEIGKTLHNYLIYYRLRVSKNLLITTPYSVEIISDMTGFCSASYYIKTFRSNVGMTPNKYRKSHRNAGI